VIAGLPGFCVLAGAATFGGVSAVLAAMGLGVPFLPGAVAVSALVGLLLYGAARSLLRVAAPDSPPPGPACDARLRLIDEGTTRLRHELRGVLSPAMLMTDRLLRSDDPAIRRAGQAVTRSIERATSLLAANKLEMDAAVRGEAVAAAPPPRSLVGESAARGP